MVGNWSPQITRGGGWTRTLSFTQAGAIFSLVDYTATMTLTPGTGTTVTLSTANGKITIDGAAGTLTTLLSKTEVTAIDWSQGVVESRLTVIPPATTGEAIELTGIANLV